MDLDKLRRCEDEDDISDLMMDDIFGGYNDPIACPNHKQIAVVDHADNFNINQLKSFFERVHKDLKVKFWVGDATLKIIDRKKFRRYFIYSDEEPLICIDFTDGIYRLQEPVIESLDGITIDLKGLTITFKNDGEVLKYVSTGELKNAISKILTEYWPEQDSPDIVIRDSISQNPGTKWMVESLSCQLTATDTQEDKIALVKRIEEFIPTLECEFDPGDNIPFAASLQLATKMNEFDSQTQDKIISRLILCFGFFDQFT